MGKGLSPGQSPVPGAQIFPILLIETHGRSLTKLELGHVPVLAADMQPRGSDVSLTLSVSPRGRYSPRGDRELQPAGAQTTAHVVSQWSPRSPRTALAGSLWFSSGAVPGHIAAVPLSHPHPDCSSQGCRGCSFGLAHTGPGSSHPL